MESTWNITNGLPDAMERRRYALLQAAATICMTSITILPEMAVDIATDILEVIERREVMEKNDPR